MKILTLSNGTANCTLQWMDEPTKFPSHMCHKPQHGQIVYANKERFGTWKQQFFLGPNFVKMREKNPKK